MTSTQIVERRIVHQLLHPGAVTAPGAGVQLWTIRLIRGLATAAAIGLLAALFPGVLWLALAASTVLALGLR